MNTTRTRTPGPTGAGGGNDRGPGSGAGRGPGGNAGGRDRGGPGGFGGPGGPGGPGGRGGRDGRDGRGGRGRPGGGRDGGRGGDRGRGGGRGRDAGGGGRRQRQVAAIQELLREIDRPMVKGEFEAQHAPLQSFGRLFEDLQLAALGDLGAELKGKVLTLLLRVGRQTKVQEDEEKEKARQGVMERLARIWLAVHDEKRASAALAAGGKEKAAAALLKQSGDWESQVQLFEALGNHDKAAATYEAQGMLAEAATAFGNAKKVKEQLRVLAKLGDTAQVVALLGKLPKEEAATLAVRFNVLDAWAQVLTEQADWLGLAHLYQAHGQPQIAAQAFEKAERYQSAYEGYAKAGDAESMERCLNRVIETKIAQDDPLGAAKALVKVGRLEKAAELVAESHPNKAHRWFVQGGYIDKALELARHQARKAEGHSDFESRATWLGLAGDHLSAATLWEGLGKTKKALVHYEQARAWEPAARIAEGLGKADESVDFYYRAGLRDEAERVKLHGPGGGVPEAAAEPPEAAS